MTQLNRTRLLHRLIQKLLAHYFQTLCIFLLGIYLVLLTTNINSIQPVIADETTYLSSTLLLPHAGIDVDHHPLLAKTIWFSTSFLLQAVTGESPALFWRIGTILFSIGTLIIFYRLCALFLSKYYALLATVFLGLDPMFFSFSRLMQVDIITLFFLLCFFYTYILWLRVGKASLLLLCGLCLGLSLATKMIGILLLLLPIFFVVQQKKRLGRWGRDVVLLYLFCFLGFVLGNLEFFTRPQVQTFFEFVSNLIDAQRTLPQPTTGNPISPLWSWFSLPQILILYRIFGETSVTTVVALQNSIGFLLNIPILLLTLYSLIKNRIHRSEYLLLILGGTLLLFPWLLGLHSTYYYYMIPVLPLFVLFTAKMLSKLKCLRTSVTVIITALWIASFAFFYPILVGIPVGFGYEKLAHSYSLFKYPPRNGMLCTFCSPIGYPAQKLDKN